MRRDIIKHLTRSKIHISAIQETNVIQDSGNLLDNYRITAETAASKREETGVVQGGTEIMIHESIQQYITQIARQSSRVLRVTLGRENSKRPIQILTTYAPHNGRAEEDRNQHWGEVKEILNKTCKRHMVIWRTDENGQIGRDEEEGGSTAKKCHSQHNRAQRQIKKTEKGNGTHKEICLRRNMIPTTTWTQPK